MIEPRNNRHDSGDVRPTAPKMKSLVRYLFSPSVSSYCF